MCRRLLCAPRPRLSRLWLVGGGAWSEVSVLSVLKFKWEWRCPGGICENEVVTQRAGNASDRGVRLPAKLQVLRDATKFGAECAAIAKASVEHVREEFSLGDDVELECRSRHF